VYDPRVRRVYQPAALPERRRFRATRRVTDLILFGLCVLPVAGVAFFLLRILAVIVLPQPGR
jgi:hypothetical protein